MDDELGDVCKVSGIETGTGLFLLAAKEMMSKFAPIEQWRVEKYRISKPLGDVQIVLMRLYKLKVHQSFFLLIFVPNFFKKAQIC